MKTLRIIPLLVLSLFLIGCDTPSGDFMMNEVIIVKKTQSAAESESNRATYYIECKHRSNSDEPLYRTTLVMSVKFGNAGDHINFDKDGKMSASPRLESEK